MMVPSYRFGAGGRHCPNAFKIDEVSLHIDSRNGFTQTLGGPAQFLFMVLALRAGIAAEGAGQSSVSAAVGMNHKDRKPGPVEADGFSDLIQDELRVRFVLWRCEALGAAGDLDLI